VNGKGRSWTDWPESPKTILMSGWTEYRGRLAPSPTGYLHLGHARTFWVAQERARTAGGVLVLRNDDLDVARCRPEFVTAALEDLRWLGLKWAEGPDVGGPFGPYSQSERRSIYERVFEQLRATGLIYPCKCSRKEIAAALSAPHAGEDEPVYPGFCRPAEPVVSAQARVGINWRFRLPIGERVSFVDGYSGPHSAMCGEDFGDVLIWRKDDFPSYQLACVVDDALMQITEVVRGADLIASTFRQLALYRTLGWPVPEYFHCPLVLNDQGERLAKREDALSIRALREQGKTAEEVRRIMIAAGVG
jgi:glutamyl/glutaminyl-tRNA synthetase